mmetsp:Transcript_38911/g.62121  ORF Transcript_38911/g.62121 Transcript_38911/m.62121 type:complete len:169 (+) Transcript_38911:101-607(+)
MKTTALIVFISYLIASSLTQSPPRGCSCEKHGLATCDDEGCDDDTQCSTQMVTHDDDDEHMHDRELTCCFPVEDESDESGAVNDGYYHVHNYDDHVHDDGAQNRSLLKWIFEGVYTVQMPVLLVVVLGLVCLVVAQCMCCALLKMMKNEKQHKYSMVKISDDDRGSSI